MERRRYLRIYFIRRSDYRYQVICLFFFTKTDIFHFSNAMYIFNDIVLGNCFTFNHHLNPNYTYLIRDGGTQNGKSNVLLVKIWTLKFRIDGKNSRSARWIRSLDRSTLYFPCLLTYIFQTPHLSWCSSLADSITFSRNQLDIIQRRTHLLFTMSSMWDYFFIIRPRFNGI